MSDETDALTRIAADPRAGASAPQSVTVAGYKGRAITISMATGAYAMTNRNRYDPSALTIAQRDEWYIFQSPGAKARVIELTVGDNDVLIYYEAQTSAFDAFAAVAEDIVACIQLTQ